LEVLKPEPEGLVRAAELLAAGEVVAFPTDTVYGLAARAADPEAVHRIFAVKNRPLDRGLVLMTAHPSELERWVELDERALAFMARWWPGPLTLVLRARPSVRPPLALDEPRTLAVRIPDHKVALELLREVGEPLATTSANASGAPPALLAQGVVWLPGVAAVIDSGRSPGGVPSTLLDLTGPEPEVLREGPIPSVQLLRR
jgi:L-threonylcarbamoyladenylate synthase